MSGLVAIVAHDRSDSIPESEVAALATSYEELRGAGTRHEAVAGRFARVVKIDAPNAFHPGIATDGSSWSCVTGAAFLTGSLTDADVESFDGQFALARYRAGPDEVEIASDPFGLHALYRAVHKNRSYFSSSALALARFLKAVPNRSRLESFLLSGYHFGTMTHWEGIERVDPATAYLFSPSGSTIRTYWQPEPPPSTKKEALGDAVERCIAGSVQTLSTLLSTTGPVWSDLTGGYDSRLMNLLLDRTQLDFATTTRDTPTVEDIEIANQLASMAGWEWLHTALPPNWHEVLTDMIPPSLGWADGNLEVLQLARVLWPHRRLGETRPFLISSGGGEHFQYAAWKSEFLKAGRSNRVNFENFVDMRMLKPINKTLLRRDPTEEVRADFITRMKSRVAPYSDELNTTQLDLLYAYKSMGHFGAYASSDAAFITALVPFYLKPVFLSAFTTDYRLRNGHKLLRHMIERLDAKLAAVPTTRGGPAQPWRLSNTLKFAPYYTQLGRKAVNKLSQKALGRTLLASPPQVWRWEHQATIATLDFMNGRSQLRAEEMRSGPLYDPTRLAAFFQRAADPSFTETPMLGRIITLELALDAADAGL